MEAKKNKQPEEQIPPKKEEVVDRRKLYENATDGTRIVADDLYLEPYAPALRDRYMKMPHIKAFPTTQSEILQ